MSTILNEIKKYEKRMQRLAKNLVSWQDAEKLELKIVVGNGSFSTTANNRKTIYIQIDPSTAYESDDTLASLLLKVKGIVAHEAGHIGYSDFSVIGENKKRELIYQQTITEIASDIKKSPDDDSLKNILRETIYQYVYYKNLADMLNSIEDAAVEYQITRQCKNMYGAVVAMRNYIYKKEADYLLNAHDIGDTHIQCYITEIRHFATIGYRESINDIFLNDILSDEQIEEIARLGFYERVCSKNTQERNEASQVLLDMLKPVLNSITDRLFDNYMQALSMSNDEQVAMSSLMQNLNVGPQELAIESCNPDLAGMNTPQTSQSEYSMKLPEDTQKKLQEKKEENSQSSNCDSQSSDGESLDSSNSEQTESGDNNSSNEGQSSEFSKNSSESNNGSLEGMTQETSNLAESSSLEMTDEKKGEMSNNDSDAKTSQNTKSNTDSPLSEEGDVLCEQNEVKNVDEIFEENFEKEQLKADNAKNESLKKEMSALEKNKTTDIKRDVMTSSEGKAPNLSNGLSSSGNISSCHENIHVNYIPSKYISSDDAEHCYKTMRDVASTNQQATKFAKDLKEVLMYQAKTRRLNGLRNGQINNSDLNRIITDQKIFKKTIKGKKKQGRIEVLIDLSGSMSGCKLRNAIKAAYMLASACQKCKVPVSVMGHCDRGDGSIELVHYLEFENCMSLDAKKKILTAKAGGCNRDGLAIFHSATDLVRHGKKDEQKVLIIISDGAPNGNFDNYCGDYAKEDIQHIEAVFEKQFGVKMIGVGIGNDVECVPHIYKNHVMVPRVDELGDKLLKIMKEILI